MSMRQGSARATPRRLGPYYPASAHATLCPCRFLHFLCIGLQGCAGLGKQNAAEHAYHHGHFHRRGTWSPPWRLTRGHAEYGMLEHPRIAKSSKVGSVLPTQIQ